MLPEVQAYFDATDPSSFGREAQQVYEAHPVQAWDHTMPADQIAAYFEAEDRQNAALRALDKAHKEKQAAAYQKLMATSESPLLRFLFTDPEVQQFPHERDIVLRALPMSREEMAAFGERQDWCGTYNRLLRRAEEAGVLPEPVA